MRALFILDLVTLLPLFLVGGAGALWWMLTSAALGCCGLLFSFGHLRAALAAAGNNRFNFRLPGYTLVALASIMLLLPGLLSDLIGIIAGLASIKIMGTSPNQHSSQHTREEPKPATSSRAREPEQGKGRIIDVNYREINQKSDREQ